MQQHMPCLDIDTFCAQVVPPTPHKPQAFPGAGPAIERAWAVLSLDGTTICQWERDGLRIETWDANHGYTVPALCIRWHARVVLLATSLHGSIIYHTGEWEQVLARHGAVPPIQEAPAPPTSFIMPSTGIAAQKQAIIEASTALFRARCATNGYGDVPIVKIKPDTETPDGTIIPYDYDAGKIVSGTGYSRARWQIDAHGFSRSSGNRFLTPEEMLSLPHEKIYKLWREESRQSIYDFERHVHLGEILEREKRLPSTFMLMPPHSWHPDVWSDEARRCI